MAAEILISIFVFMFIDRTLDFILSDKCMSRLWRFWNWIEGLKFMDSCGNLKLIYNKNSIDNSNI